MNNPKLAITICSTKNYTYAMGAVARRIQAATTHLEDGYIILSGDKSIEFANACSNFEYLMPKWKIISLKHDIPNDKFKNYECEAQLLISRLQTAAFSEARKLDDIDRCLSIEADVLIPYNAIKCMEWALKFDDGFYDVSTAVYSSQGGGGWLFGGGNPYRQILPDFYEDEREVPKETVEKLKDLREVVNKYKDPRTAKPEELKDFENKVKELQELEKELDKYPPKDNIWALNAKQYRKRGWGDNYMPGLFAKGAMIKTDWCGWGATMMSLKALNLAMFDGYDGKGTSDLYIVWNRWHSAGINICSLPHCLCDHILRDKNKPGKYIHSQPYHELQGECEGHLRLRFKPWYSQDINEQFNPENDGKFTPETSKANPDK